MKTQFAIDMPLTLVVRLKKGDIAAFEQMYRLFEKPVYTLALRMLNHRDEAQEILQETMLTVLERVRQFRSEAPFWGWLRQIAVNHALMHLRKQSPDYLDELPEPEAALHEFEAQALKVDIEKALGKLPALTRSVLWLYYVEGYGHEDIAAAFSKTVSFSKSQLSRGTQKLREQLHAGQEVLVYA